MLIEAEVSGMEKNFLGCVCAVLGLCCCVRAFSSWQGLVFIAVSGPLIVVASL